MPAEKRQIVLKLPPVNTWPVYIYALIILAATPWIFNEAFNGLAVRWEKWDENYAHGWFIVFMVLALAIRQTLRGVTPGNPAWSSIIVLLLITLMCSVSHAVGIEIIEQLLLPAFIWFLFALGGGWIYARGMLFPCLLAYFAIPIWDYIVPVLIQVTVSVVSLWLSLTNISVYIEGNDIALSSGVVSVAYGCSGSRYFIVALVFSSLYGYFYTSSLKSKSILLLAGMVAGLVANWIRVYSLVLVGHFTHMKSELMHDHELYGFVVFGLCLLLLLLFFEKFPLKYVEPYARTKISKYSLSYSNYIVLVAGVLFLSGVHNYGSYLITQHVPELVERRGFDNSNRADLFFIADPERVIDREIAAIDMDGNTVNFIVNHYQQEKTGSDFLPYKNWLDRQAWKSVSKSHVKLITGESIVAMNLINRNTNQKWSMVYWFETGPYLSSDYYTGKILELSALLKKRRDGRLFIATMPCANSCEESSSLLIGLINSNAELQPLYGTLEQR